MWECPNIEGTLKKNEIVKKVDFVISIEKGIENVHVFTHKKWNMKSYLIEVNKELSDYIWLTLEEIEKDYAIPTAFMPFLEYLKERNK